VIGIALAADTALKKSGDIDDSSGLNAVLDSLNNLTQMAFATAEVKFWDMLGPKTLLPDIGRNWECWSKQSQKPHINIRRSRLRFFSRKTSHKEAL